MFREFMTDMGLDSRGRLPQASFRPALEALEERTVPSASSLTGEAYSTSQALFVLSNTLNQRPNAKLPFLRNLATIQNGLRVQMNQLINAYNLSQSRDPDFLTYVNYYRNLDQSLTQHIVLAKKIANDRANNRLRSNIYGAGQKLMYKQMQEYAQRQLQDLYNGLSHALTPFSFAPH